MIFDKNSYDKRKQLRQAFMPKATEKSDSIPLFPVLPSVAPSKTYNVKKNWSNQKQLLSSNDVSKSAILFVIILYLIFNTKNVLF